MEVLSVAEAKSRFSELISRAASGERIVIKRRDRQLIALIGISDLERLERAAQATRSLALALGQNEEILDKIDQGELPPIMAAYGLWKDDSELDELFEEINQNRARQPKRKDLNL